MGQSARIQSAAFPKKSKMVFFRLRQSALFVAYWIGRRQSAPVVALAEVTQFNLAAPAIISMGRIFPKL
jgi:hypothetical protein